MFMIAFLCLLLALLTILLLRLPSPTPDPSLQRPDHHGPQTPQTPPLPTRHVSFSLVSVSSDTSYSLPVSPSASLPSHRRWTSPFHKRKPSASDHPCAPQPQTAQNSPAHHVDQFGRLPPSSSASSDVHPSTKFARRFSTPLRLSLTAKRRSSSVSCTSTLIPLDQVDTRVPSSPPSTSTPLLTPPLQRPRFVNPFRKHLRSRTLSPPSTSKSFDTPSNSRSTSPPPPPPQGRRSLVNKFKSVFKPISPQPSPVILSKPIVKTVNTRLRRKPVARTQPYGPPWNAPMPVLDFTLSQHSLQKHAETISPSPQTSRKLSINQSSLHEKTVTSPGQLSPHTFISELDEKLFLLQQQRIQDLIPSPTVKQINHESRPSCTFD